MHANFDTEERGRGLVTLATCICTAATGTFVLLLA